jgi:hypothetical protein
LLVQQQRAPALAVKVAAAHAIGAGKGSGIERAVVDGAKPKPTGGRAWRRDALGDDGRTAGIAGAMGIGLHCAALRCAAAGGRRRRKDFVCIGYGRSGRWVRPLVLSSSSGQPRPIAASTMTGTAETTATTPLSAVSVLPSFRRRPLRARCASAPHPPSGACAGWSGASVRRARAPAVGGRTPAGAQLLGML